MFLSLSGSDGSAVDLPLAASSAAFEPGSIDTFTIMLPHLGKVHTAALHLGPEGARPGWHLAWLHVASEEPLGADAHGATANPEEYRFLYKCALARGPRMRRCAGERLLACDTPRDRTSGRNPATSCCADVQGSVCCVLCARAQCTD